jgi:Branched-chain amino acid transport system / permease component
MTAGEGTHVGTQGESPAEVGFRNQLRGRWRRLPAEQRMGISMAILLLFAILLFFVDHSLGYAVLIGGAIYWLEKLPYWPHRVAATSAFVILLALLALVWSTPWSLVVLLALVLGFTLIPQPWRSRLLPAAAVIATIMYPFYFAKLFTLPVFGAWPDVATGVYMLVFIMMAVGLNIVVGYAGLLDLGYVAFYATGAYTAAWFASQQFSGQKCPQKGVSAISTSARSGCCPGPAASTSRSGCCSSPAGS